MKKVSKERRVTEGRDGRKSRKEEKKEGRNEGR